VPEGVATADGQVTGGVHDDPDSPPPASEKAPKGWAWQRGSKSWAPRQRGPVLWRPDERSGAPEVGTGGERTADPVTGAPEDQQQDPDPSYMREEPGGPERQELSFDEVPQAVKDDIAGLAGMIGTPILAMLQSLDPYCGTVLAANFEPIIDRTLPLICRSEKIVRYFTEDKADWLLWGKLAMVLAPVAKAFAEHHIFRTVRVEKNPETGEVTIVREGQDQGHGDHLQPPVIDPLQYAA